MKNCNFPIPTTYRKKLERNSHFYCANLISYVCAEETPLLLWSLHYICVTVYENIIMSMTTHNASVTILTFVSTGKIPEEKKCRPLTGKHSAYAEHQKLSDTDFSGPC